MTSGLAHHPLLFWEGHKTFCQTPDKLQLKALLDFFFFLIIATKYATLIAYLFQVLGDLCLGPEERVLQRKPEVLLPPKSL